jgi:hypothetical protein
LRSGRSVHDNGEHVASCNVWSRQGGLTFATNTVAIPLARDHFGGMVVALAATLSPPLPSRRQAVRCQGLLL